MVQAEPRAGFQAHSTKRTQKHRARYLYLPFNYANGTKGARTFIAAFFVTGQACQFIASRCFPLLPVTSSFGLKPFWLEQKSDIGLLRGSHLLRPPSSGAWTKGRVGVPL